VVTPVTDACCATSGPAPVSGVIILDGITDVMMDNLLTATLAEVPAEADEVAAPIGWLGPAGFVLACGVATQPPISSTAAPTIAIPTVVRFLIRAQTRPPLVTAIRPITSITTPNKIRTFPTNIPHKL